MRLPTVRIKNSENGRIIKINRDDWLGAIANGQYHNYNLISDQTRVNKDEQLKVIPSKPKETEPTPVPEVEVTDMPVFNIGTMNKVALLEAANEFYDTALDEDKHLLTLRKEFADLVKKAAK